MTRPQTVAGGYWAPVMVMRYSISNFINNRNDFHDHELRQFAWSQVLTAPDWPLIFCHNPSSSLSNRLTRLKTFMKLMFQKKRSAHLTDGILPRDDARFIDWNIYTGFIIRGIHHVWDLSITNKFLPLTARRPGNVWHIPCGGGDLMVTQPQVTSGPSCWPLHTLEISPHWKLALVSDW